MELRLDFMNPRFSFFAWVALVFATGGSPVAAADRTIPEPLQIWEDWAIWDLPPQEGPRPFNDATTRLLYWPSELSLRADASSGSFTFRVKVYHESWVPLPGNSELWPLNVLANGKTVPVLSDGNHPRVRLAAGDWEITGEFLWEEMPQRIAVPGEIGILLLALDDKPVEAPIRDTAGHVWLKRAKAEETHRDFMAVQVYRLIEDGIPIWLRTEIELSVTGRSREEELGSVLPEGWKLAVVNAPIPCAVDENGHMKAQVRAGKWVIRLDAFRTDSLTAFRYAEGAHPVAKKELIGLKSAPELRIVEIRGLQAVDVSQTTYPERWRNYPVYLWETADTEFQLEEKMRGMGFQRPAGLAIRRELWLDEDGKNLTYQDHVTGTAQRVWRLNVAEGQQLGAVKINGEGQLITRDPVSGAEGVEVRQRDIKMEAVGRATVSAQLPASGWRAEAENVRGVLLLPPGWRLFALLGAAWVNGDWLSSWSLLDLFLLLVFSMAIGRAWGVTAGIIAFGGFVLAYHEPAAPRFTWLFLLVPLLLIRVAPQGNFMRVLKIWKFTAAVLLALVLLPFLARQIQSALYPQLEKERPSFMQIGASASEYGRLAARSSEAAEPAAPAEKQKPDSNLLWDAQARIQTGPAVPKWSWREISFGWNGPVSATQTIRPLLIPPAVERILIVARIVLLLSLAVILLRPRTGAGKPVHAATATLLAFLFATGLSSTNAADFPNERMLNLLRERLTRPDDAFPNAASIPKARLAISGPRITMEAEVHTAENVAVPLPGRLPVWSPLTVFVDEEKASAVMRRNDFIWVALEPGVHNVRVEGLLDNASEWEWTFLLKPRTLQIDAPDWTVTGLRPGGIPEQQIFFSVKDRSREREAAYDRKDFNTVVAVERHLEIGLVWHVHTEVHRLSPKGKAISLDLPLLPGERVLSSRMQPENGRVEVRLGAIEDAVSWNSELALQTSLVLAAENTDRWVARWHLVTSPVWNVAITGLEPVFEPDTAALIPVWHPWPGESVTLAITRPIPVTGETMTIREVNLRNNLGAQHRTGHLELDVHASLGDDFPILLPGDAAISTLRVNEQQIPVRKEGAKVIVPVRPGDQRIEVDWQSATPLHARLSVDEVTLPVQSSNISTTLIVPQNRWVLWTFGPVRGPAVRFWPMFIGVVIIALFLGRLELSPFRKVEWALLALGLTQVMLPAALFLVGWLFLLSWRGRHADTKLSPWPFNLLQVLLVLSAIPVVAILLVILHRGLLGSPEMFILGNGSNRAMLNWFQPRASETLPNAGLISISIWFYRGLMLAWALWLARAFLRWVPWGWQQFSTGHLWKKRPPRKDKTPPPIPEIHP